MAMGLSLHTRRELLEHRALQYREALPAQKQDLLDEFTRITAYHRTYAQWLLNHSEQVLRLQDLQARPLTQRMVPVALLPGAPSFKERFFRRTC